MPLEPPKKEEEQTEQETENPESIQQGIKSVGAGIVGAIGFAMIAIGLVIAVNSQQTNWFATCVILIIGAISIVVIAWTIN